MIRPALGETAFVAVLMRELCLDEQGKAVFVEDHPADKWAEIDDMEPTWCRLANMRVSLLSVNLDETTTRAVFEIEDFPVDSPMGPTRPRMGDLVALEIGSTGLHQTYLVVLTGDDVTAGADADIGPNEILLNLHCIFFETLDD
jgi:hypothetical protein